MPLTAKETRKALDLLATEIRRARAKHPTNRFLDIALTEELGEAVAPNTTRDLISSPSPDPQFLQPGNIEWLHVACVALRIYMEGSTPLEDGPEKFGSYTVQGQFHYLGQSAHEALHSLGVLD